MPDLPCPHCGTDNRPGRRYCAQCGANLPVACAACGFANEAGEKFCGGCGTPLGTGVGPPPAPAPPSRESGAGERRPVTVVFADLVDYTRLSQRLDLEDVHAPWNLPIADATSSPGGSVDKHIGDSVMAVLARRWRTTTTPCARCVPRRDQRDAADRE
jgi:hypothetical protein